jgi:hypothetical protein
MFHGGSEKKKKQWIGVIRNESRCVHIYELDIYGNFSGLPYAQGRPGNLTGPVPWIKLQPNETFVK